MTETTIRIEKLGHLGDGIAAGPVFAPLTLPGELVAGQLHDGRLTQPRILEASDARQRPPCPHYRACGGCVIQHAKDDFVADWKVSVVREALASRGIDAPISGIETSPPQSRRRATLHGRRTKSGTIVGFHGRASGLLTDIPRCLVLAPELLAALPLLHELTALLASRKGEVDFALTLTDGGIDLAATLPVTPPDTVIHQAVALGQSLARLTINGEVRASYRPARIKLGPADVTLPPGAFLQATRQGEAALSAAVLAHSAGATQIVDLFAGLGTFALPLATASEVHAVEGDKVMVAALQEAANRTPALRRVTSEARDLFRRPLTPDELKNFDAVVIDPPRAGAEAQVAELARSTVPKIAMVSCNPATFARDLGALGSTYRIDEITVVDQFRWSHHIECVAKLTKA